jgi:hypothetical protein
MSFGHDGEVLAQRPAVIIAKAGAEGRAVRRGGAIAMLRESLP